MSETCRHCGEPIRPGRPVRNRRTGEMQTPYYHANGGTTFCLRDTVAEPEEGEA